MKFSLPQSNFQLIQSGKPQNNYGKAIHPMVKENYTDCRHFESACFSPDTKASRLTVSSNQNKKSKELNLIFFTNIA